MSPLPNLMQNRPDALFFRATEGLIINRRVQIVTLATRHGLPAIYPTREFAEIGGLMSYGANNADEQYRQTGIYAGRILKGPKGRPTCPCCAPASSSSSSTCKPRR